MTAQEHKEKRESFSEYAESRSQYLSNYSYMAAFYVTQFLVVCFSTLFDYLFSIEQAIRETREPARNNPDG